MTEESDLTAFSIPEGNSVMMGRHFKVKLCIKKMKTITICQIFRYTVSINQTKTNCMFYILMGPSRSQYLLCARNSIIKHDGLRHEWPDTACEEKYSEFQTRSTSDRLQSWKSEMKPLKTLETFNMNSDLLLPYRKTWLVWHNVNKTIAQQRLSPSPDVLRVLTEMEQALCNICAVFVITFNS